MSAQRWIASPIFCPQAEMPGIVFSKLTGIAEEWAQHAGSTDVPMLRARLEQEGIALNDAPARRRAFDRLQEASQHLLDPAAARVGNRLHLPRPTLRRAVRSAVEEHDILVLAGRAGGRGGGPGWFTELTYRAYVVACEGRLPGRQPLPQQIVAQAEQRPSLTPPGSLLRSSVGTGPVDFTSDGSARAD